MAPPVSNIRLSTVGPGRATGSDVSHVPTGLDLAMKLHYLKAVYIFTAEAARGLTIEKIKEATFLWFNEIFWVCGRFRRNDQGRPFIKCNDCGVRFVEGTSDQTVEEWLTPGDRAIDETLVYHKPVGPELAFSPLIYIQVTKFKCGGISLGLSWAHVLNDPYSFSDMFNILGDIISGNQQHIIPKPPSPNRGFPNSNLSQTEPISIKRVNPVGDHWVNPNNRRIATFSFHLTASQISHTKSKVSSGKNYQSPVFESLCALLWKCIARVREKSEPKTVTVIRKDPSKANTNLLSNNSQIISSVQTDSPVADANLEELAKLLAAQEIDEKTRIAQAVDKDNGSMDYIVYGANLTFVDLSTGADLYGFKASGHSAESVYYNIDGVGDEGAVAVLPEGGGEGRMVTMTMPEEEILRLKSELKRNDLLLDNTIE